MPAVPHTAVADQRLMTTPHASADATTHASAPVPSDRLMQGRKLLEISHNGTVYRLQQTRQGKLILTK